MRRVIGTLVVWLLAVAVPVQGLAAAAMLHCAPLHDHDAAHATHAHPAPTSHDDATVDALPLEHASHQGSEGHASPVHSCSACASCNVGIGLPSAATPLDEPVAVSVVRPLATPVRAAFLTPGPERPPRGRAA